MEHVVFYPYEGGSAFKRVGSLDEAVSFVEHLRNSENITEFNVHSLTPVPVSFRAYYHVEVPADGAAPRAAAQAPVAEIAPAPEVTVPAPAAPAFAVPSLAAPVEVPEVPAAEVETVAEPVAEEPVAVEAAAAPAAVDVPELPEVPDLPELPEAVAEEDVTLAPIEAIDEPAEPVEEPTAEASTEDAPEESFDESFEAAGDEDRSEEWVAEAPVVEESMPTPALAPLEAPVPAGPFASAPPVTPKDSDDVVPSLPTGKRTMGFFAR